MFLLFGKFGQICDPILGSSIQAGGEKGSWVKFSSQIWTFYKNPGWNLGFFAFLGFVGKPGQLFSPSLGSSIQAGGEKGLLVKFPAQTWTFSKDPEWDLFFVFLLNSGKLLVPFWDCRQLIMVVVMKLL